MQTRHTYMNDFHLISLVFAWESVQDTSHLYRPWLVVILEIILECDKPDKSFANQHSWQDHRLWEWYQPSAKPSDEYGGANDCPDSVSPPVFLCSGKFNLLGESGGKLRGLYSFKHLSTGGMVQVILSEGTLISWQQTRAIQHVKYSKFEPSNMCEP